MKGDWGEKGSNFFVLGFAQFFCFARVHSRSIRGLEKVIQEHFECWANADESNDKFKIEYVLY